MEKIKKVFGEINLTWTKVIIFAIVAGIYSAIMAIIPITNNTSFADITITFEVWILFGIIIIMNSKSAIDSALKCFVFFLISQPLIYLIQVPFSELGFQLFIYYRYWFVWTLLTFPMGFIGYYIKKDKWWGLLILTPILVLLGYHYIGFLKETISFFPNHLLSTIFCIVTMIIYPLVLFKNKTNRIIGLIISSVVIIVITIIVLISGKTTYNTTVMVSNGSEGIVFDNNYKAYLEDKEYGNIYIVYDNNLNDFIMNADFSKVGKTELVIETPNGNKIVYEIDIKRDSYELTKKSN